MSGIKTLVEVREEATNCPVVPHNENGWKGGSTDKGKRTQKINTLFSQLLLSSFI